jgi:hypothetical protein
MNEQNEPMILHPDQVDELRRLLGTVEDWLLHASFDTLDELGGFLTALSWGTRTPPERLTTQLITDLGEATLTLRPASAQPRPHSPRTDQTGPA